MSTDQTLQSIADVLAANEQHLVPLDPNRPELHWRDITGLPEPRPVPSPEDRMRDARTDREYADRIPAPRPLTTDRTNSHHRDLHQHIAGLEADLRSQTRAVLEVTAERDRHRQELGAAGEVLAVVRDAAERIDRALAAYDTTPGESEPEVDPDEDQAAIEKLIAIAHEDFASANGQSERVQAIRDLLDGWYAAWPDTAVTDPHEPIAWELAGLIAAVEATTAAPSSVPPRRAQEQPRIIVLCGSTRFRDDFHRVNRGLTLVGHIVIAPGVFGHADGIQPTDEQKVALDELHLRKIDLADEVYVVNPGGYIGDSTRREIEYAKRVGKPVTYLHSPAAQPSGARR